MVSGKFCQSHFIADHDGPFLLLNKQSKSFWDYLAAEVENLDEEISFSDLYPMGITEGEAAKSFEIWVGTNNE